MQIVPDIIMYGFNFQGWTGKNVGGPDQLRVKTFCVFRHSNHVHMVWHQSVCQYFNAVFITTLGHEPDVIPVIALTEKSILPAISTLRYMMGIMLCNYSCNMCHALFLCFFYLLSITKLP